MTHQAEAAVQDEGSLDVLMEAEQQLDQRLDDARRQADARVQQARAAAQERIGGGRQRLAADAARRLAESQQAVDDLLAREAQEKEQELSRTWAGVEAFRAELSARILAEVLGR
jgi:hypothetical protein